MSPSEETSITLARERVVKMIRIAMLTVFLVLFQLTTLTTNAAEPPGNKFSGAAGEVRLITLDPGHFHAALVQKTMYDRISPVGTCLRAAGSGLG